MARPSLCSTGFLPLVRRREQCWWRSVLASAPVRLTSACFALHAACRAVACTTAAPVAVAVLFGPETGRNAQVQRQHSRDVGLTDDSGDDLAQTGEASFLVQIKHTRRGNMFVGMVVGNKVHSSHVAGGFPSALPAIW